MKTKINRRNFVSTTSVVGAGLLAGLPTIACSSFGSNAKPAILGGPKAFTGKWLGWPVFGEIEEKELLTVLKSGQWCRLGSKTAPRFEDEYQKITGAKHALAVSSGTNALFTMLGALNIGPGDEVIIPPYTFIATYNVVVLHYALPVFVDSDLESFQIDANKIEAAITDRTRIIMPVHLGGNPVDLDKVLEVANKYKIPVIEDACQAHLSEWKGKCVGNWGLAGGFSFQGSKNLNSGEGGAIISNDDDFAAKCKSFHHQGQGANAASLEPGTGTRGTNVRLTEFQAAILLGQMTRIEEQAKIRNENAAYLTKMLKQIPGIKPAKLYKGVTRSAYHLYMFRYDKEMFAGMDRSKFMKALEAEGVTCSGGYGKMNKDAYVSDLAKNKHYLTIYGEKTMNEWLERNHCPENDKLTDQAVWFTQNMLLGTKTDMDQIAEAVSKIHKNASDINKA
ncbi:MAG TPA: DegT/DnrJ/EryC1/StrS family aminotransferase [Bacteroidales bacterium]|nr:DegT/DnrJ/EryC1/StrS family aminotransferase [Bacteroidales bacterium]